MAVERPLLPRVVVRFKQGVNIRYADHIGLVLDELQEGKWKELESRFPGIEILRLIRSITPQQLEGVVKGAEGAFSGGRQFALSTYVIECPDSFDPRKLAQELALWSIVESAHVDTIPRLPQGCSTAYLGPAAGGGIDAQFANAQAGGDGNGEPFIDLELAWTFQHQAIAGFGLTGPLFGAMINDPASFEHGTSTLGVVCGNDGAGFVGVAPGARLDGVVSYKRNDKSVQAVSTIPDAIEAAANRLRTLGGGVLLLEVMTDDFTPIETDPDCFQAILRAVSGGIVVIEAAGNNNIDLDTSPLVRDANGVQYLSRTSPAFQDSGAIMVGSSDHASAGFTRRPNSNFGSRIDCYAWGDGVQTSVASGPGASNGLGPPCFRNTSAAAAIIAGAALCVQGMNRQLHGGARLTPQQLRAKLGDPALGTVEATGLVGVMPDLKQVFASL